MIYAEDSTGAKMYNLDDVDVLAIIEGAENTSFGYAKQAATTGQMVTADIVFDLASETDWEFTLDGATSLVSKYTGQGGSVTVPATLDGRLTVIQLSNASSGPFTKNQNITSVDYSAGVVHKSNNMSYAFSGCSVLSRVQNIPNGLTNMSYTF